MDLHRQCHRTTISQRIRIRTTTAKTTMTDHLPNKTGQVQISKQDSRTLRVLQRTVRTQEQAGMQGPAKDTDTSPANDSVSQANQYGPGRKTAHAGTRGYRARNTRTCL